MHCLYTTEITSDDDMMNGTISDMPDWEAMGMVGGNLGYFEEEGKDPSQPYTGTVLDQVENLAKLQYTTMIHDDYGLDYIEGGAKLSPRDGTCPAWIYYQRGSGWYRSEMGRCPCSRCTGEKDRCP